MLYTKYLVLCPIFLFRTLRCHMVTLLLQQGKSSPKLTQQWSGDKALTGVRECVCLQLQAITTTQEHHST